MTLPNPSIYTYTMNDVSADTGRKKPASDFHVFTNEEIIHNEKMLCHPVRSTHFTIGLLIKGEAQIQLNLVDYTLTKNSLFIIPQNVIHQFKGEKDDSLMFVIAFSRDFLGLTGMHIKHIEAFDFLSSHSNPHLLLNDFEVKTLYTLLSLLREKVLCEEDHPFKGEIIQHSFNLFMLEIAGISLKYRQNENIKLTRKEDILMAFAKLLSQHFKEERSVRYYADALYVTPKHLTKTIKEITSKTSGELIDEMVITEAKILLDDLSMSVANVADALNFSDQFFFSKFFKKRAGVNPSEYKASMHPL